MKKIRVLEASHDSKSWVRLGIYYKNKQVERGYMRLYKFTRWGYIIVHNAVKLENLL